MPESGEEGGNEKKFKAYIHNNEGFWMAWLHIIEGF